MSAALEPDTDTNANPTPCSRTARLFLAWSLLVFFALILLTAGNNVSALGALAIWLCVLLVWALLFGTMLVAVYLSAGCLMGVRNAVDLVARRVAAQADARARKSQQGAAVVPALPPRGRGDEVSWTP